MWGQQVLDSVVEYFQRVGLFRIGISQTWFGNRQLAASFADLFKAPFDFLFAQTIDRR